MDRADVSKEVWDGRRRGAGASEGFCDGVVKICFMSLMIRLKIRLKRNIRLKICFCHDSLKIVLTITTGFAFANR